MTLYSLKLITYKIPMEFLHGAGKVKHWKNPELNIPIYCSLVVQRNMEICLIRSAQIEQNISSWITQNNLCIVSHVAL